MYSQSSPAWQHSSLSSASISNMIRICQSNGLKEILSVFWIINEVQSSFVLEELVAATSWETDILFWKVDTRNLTRRNKFHIQPYYDHQYPTHELALEQISRTQMVPQTNFAWWLPSLNIVHWCLGINKTLELVIPTASTQLVAPKSNLQFIHVYAAIHVMNTVNNERVRTYL